MDHRGLREKKNLRPRNGEWLGTQGHEATNDVRYALGVNPMLRRE